MINTIKAVCLWAMPGGALFQGAVMKPFCSWSRWNAVMERLGRDTQRCAFLFPFSPHFYISELLICTSLLLHFFSPARKLKTDVAITEARQLRTIHNYRIISLSSSSSLSSCFFCFFVAWTLIVYSVFLYRFFYRPFIGFCVARKQKTL